jgi:hypothetical protein
MRDAERNCPYDGGAETIAQRTDDRQSEIDRTATDETGPVTTGTGTATDETGPVTTGTGTATDEMGTPTPLFQVEPGEGVGCGIETAGESSPPRTRETSAGCSRVIPY